MQQPPDIDMIFPIDVEDQVKEMFQRPATHAGQLEFKRVAGRTAFGMMRDMPVCLFKGIDETQRDLIAGLLEVMIHGLQEIQVRPGAPDDGLDAHLPNMVPDMVAQALEVGGIGATGGSGSRPVE